MTWREKRVPLGILGVFLLANAVFFFTYRVQYENRLQALEGDKHGAEQRLANLRAERAKTDQQIAGYRKAQSELTMIYNDKWATEPQRLTALINEVKRLERASQLVGRAHAFAKSEKDAKDTKDAKLTQGLGTDVVTISFTVQGTYQQVRRLINLLELSDQFVIIDGISLSGNDAGPPPPGAQLAGGPPPPVAGPLTMTLRLKTIFRATAPPPAPRQANQQL
jgi:hypothetical protein